MRCYRAALLAAAVLVLSACDSSSSSVRSASTAALPEPCLSSPCASKAEALYIFDAENSAYSADGRLFISGGEAVVEILRNGDGELQAQLVSSEACNYTGLTMIGDTLYAACGDNRIFAADISALPLLPIYSVAEATLSNGLAALGGRLYLTDGPIALMSKIIQLDIEPSNPFSITAQRAWTGPGELLSANGIQAVAGEIWVTDFNQLKAFAVAPDGSVGEGRTLLTQGVSTFDDFTVLSNGNIVITDYLGGTAYMFDQSGNVLDSSTDLSGPSSAIQGRPPLFDASQIIVTEKGLLSDRSVNNGNQLAIYTAN